MGGAWVERVVVGVLATVVLALAVGAPAASGEALSPWWGLSSGSEPTNLVTGGAGQIVVSAENRGDAGTAGEVTISDLLPAGLQATAIEAVAGEAQQGGGSAGPVSCTLATLTCTFGTFESEGVVYQESLPPYQQIEVRISVSVKAGASNGEQNTAIVSGGGAVSPVSASHAIELDGSEKFGVEDFQASAENAGGSLDTQAGSHPFQLTSVVTLNTRAPEPGGPETVGQPKDIVPELPAGLLADPIGLARCTEGQLAIDRCPAQSAVGAATVTFNESANEGVDTVATPIFNMEPLRGEPARFGINLLSSRSVLIETQIRSGGDYGVKIIAGNITQTVWLLSLKLTFWGVPGDQRHDAERGRECLKNPSTCTSTTEGTAPFLSLPSSCGGPLESTVEGDSWTQAGARQKEGLPPQLEPLRETAMAGVVGCNKLPFSAVIHTTPDVEDASTPSGLNVDLHVPQTASSDPEGLDESSVKDITIALPEGVALNPAAAGDLEACSQGLIGFEGVKELPVKSGTSMPTFTPYLPGSFAALAAGEDEPLRPGVNFCPNAAELGTVKIATPLLANPLEGAVYLASPQSFPGGPSENPLRSPVAVYVVAEEPEAGVLVKLPGKITLDQQTGQITVTFEDTPRLPFEDIDLAFFGGERALLATPARCGSYTTQASFVPWSAEASDVAALTVHSSSTFGITTGPKTLSEPGGSQCPGGQLPFNPSLTAGTTSLQAGSYSPLTMTIGREDGQQAIQSMALTLPPGLTGMISSVPLCPQAQASAGTCPAASQIGETTLGAGVGGEPYTLTGGRIYLTEAYDGAPFGLSIVVPAEVGPFVLQEGRPIVIRAKLEIDPATAALTIATAAIPTIIEGFPLQIQHLNITINRPGFILNPTDCAPLKITGTIDGDEGASAGSSVPFRAANCATLKFAPKLTAGTQGHAEALKGGNGASLNVEIASRGGPDAGGEEANLKRLDITLPKLLPARLQPTLQHACTRAQFARNPASCPPDSFVGTATVGTSILPGAPGGGSGGKLIGPAIFVSQGGTSLPNLDLVLQGEGTSIVLTGATQIKGGETYAKFEAVPDIPISSFALSLPQGPHSALASGLPTNKHSLCGQALEMPTTIEGQNGAVVKQTTKVSIQGCKHKKPKRHKQKRHAK
jgi:hypothetical protein